MPAARTRPGAPARRRALAHAAVASATTLLLLGPPTWLGARAQATERRSLPLPHHAVVRQSDPRGCGAALLATLLARQGRPVAEAALLAAAPPGPRGISLAAFAELAASHGLAGAWYRTPPGELPGGAYVAHLDRPEGHFVWISSRAGDYLRVTDPAGGEALWHVRSLAARFSGRYFRVGGAP